MKAKLTEQTQLKVTGRSRTISVVRSQPWQTGKQAFQRPAFLNGKGVLRVQFIWDPDESTEDNPTSVADSEVIDAGGPRREFFRLLLKDIAHKSGLFAGMCYALSDHT